MKPSAHKAHPEQELRTVIATGISAEPMLFVIFQPIMEEVAADYKSMAVPKSGNLVIIYKAAAFIPNKGLLRLPAIGKFIFSLGHKPCNFLNAAKEP